MHNTMKSTTGSSSGAGRPRDRRIDDAVLAATRELLVSEGYSGLSLTAVATAAGTSTPAIYRRWPTKAHLVHEAAFPATEPVDLAFSGDLEADVRALVMGAVALFIDPVVRAALPGLIADLGQHPELHAELMSRLWGSHVEGIQEILDAAAARGLARPGLSARHLLSLVGGSALLSVVAPSGDGLDDAWIEAIAALVVKGLVA